MAVDWMKAAPVTKVARTGAKKDKSAKAVLLANLDKQIALAKNPKTEGNRWWTVDGDLAQFTMRFSSRPMDLRTADVRAKDDKDNPQPVLVRQWPVKELAAIYESLKASVQDGKFDDQLAEREKMIAARSAKAVATRAANKAA